MCARTQWKKTLGLMRVVAVWCDFKMSARLSTKSFGSVFLCNLFWRCCSVLMHSVTEYAVGLQIYCADLRKKKDCDIFLTFQQWPWILRHWPLISRHWTWPLRHWPCISYFHLISMTEWMPGSSAAREHVQFVLFFNAAFFSKDSKIRFVKSSRCFMQKRL